jgi:hypothetical protein
VNATSFPLLAKGAASAQPTTGSGWLLWSQKKKYLKAEALAELKFNNPN